MPCFSSLPRKDSSLLSRSCSSACSLSYEVEPSDEYLYVQPPLPAYAPRQSPATIPPYSSYSNPVLLPRARSSEESNHRPFSSTSDSVSPFLPLPPEELQTSTCLSPPAKQPVPPKSVPVASPPRSHLETHEASVTWDMAMYRWLIPGRSSRSTKLWAVGGEFHVDAWQALAKLLQSQTLRDCVCSHPRSS